MGHIGVEDWIVVDAVQKHQIQTIRRPFEKIIRASSPDGRDVFTAPCVIIEILSGPPSPVIARRLAEVFTGYGACVALGWW